LNGGGTTYLGWNEQGSWLVAAGFIFVWNLKENRVREVYKNFKDIPKDVLASLKNSPYSYGVAKTSAPQPKSEGPHPVTPDTSRQQAFFGSSDAAKNALAQFQGSAPPAVTTERIAGTGAVVVGGVLTFTDANGAKKAFKVVRPKVAMGPPSAGDAGTWLAIDEQMMFTVQNDKTVTGQKAPPVLFQMLMQQTH
jgi:hypothetical protein